MKAIEQERLKWAESYDGKVVMIEQLQRELAHTVEALHVEKSADRSSFAEGIATYEHPSSHEHSSVNAQEHSRIFDTSFSSHAHPSIVQQGGRGGSGSGSGDRYQGHPSENLSVDYRYSSQQLQQNPSPLSLQQQRQQRQQQQSYEHAKLHHPTHSNEPPVDGHRDTATASTTTTATTNHSHMHPNCQYCGQSPHHYSSDSADTTQSRHIETLQRENTTLKERISTLMRREREASQETVSATVKLEEITAAWRDSEGKLRFRAQQVC